MDMMRVVDMRFMHIWITYVVGISVCVWWGKSKTSLLSVNFVSVGDIVYAYVVVLSHV